MLFHLSMKIRRRVRGLEALVVILASYLCEFLAHPLGSSPKSTVTSHSLHLWLPEAQMTTFSFLNLRLRGGDQDTVTATETEDIHPDLTYPTMEDMQLADGSLDLREPPQHKQERFRKSAELGMDLVGDGGLFKRTVRSGDGSAYPIDGDYIYVHYRGFVISDGREFDDSRRSEQLQGRPFGFTLGKGEV
jgi:hypothetical protein